MLNQVSAYVTAMKVMSLLIGKRANPVRNIVIGPKAQTRSQENAGTTGSWLSAPTAIKVTTTTSNIELIFVNFARIVIFNYSSYESTEILIPVRWSVTFMEHQDSLQKIDNVTQPKSSQHEIYNWPPRPESFAELLTPIEAAQYLRLDETSIHTPQSAVRVLNYWRDRGELKATKFARRVWYRKTELDKFLEVKTKG
jgi:hypothetical protein